MSKYTQNNQEIYDDILSDYQEELKCNLSGIEDTLKRLISHSLGCVIHNSEYYGSDKQVPVYMIASKFIQKYNKDIKDNRRKLRPYEAGGDNQILARHSPELIALSKYVLGDGQYMAVLDDAYAMLTIKSVDMYQIESDLYIVGRNYKKYKDKFYKKIDKYEKLKKSEKSEYVYFSNQGKSAINTIFKSFDQVIFRDKKQVLRYIDNWIKCIPAYYNKYNTISKLSILLYGPPGTGKSTFYKALAKYLNINNVTVLSQDYFSQQMESNGRYTNYNMRYGGGNEGTVFAIDDIDCICESRKEGKHDMRNSSVLSNLLSFLDNPPTFNFQAPDRVKYPVSIVIATTNYFDKLDPAVKRYGRFDLLLEMGNFNREYAQQMCDIYGLQLDDIVSDANEEGFTIAPSKLQAICFKNIDKELKNSVDKECSSRLITIHRIK